MFRNDTVSYHVGDLDQAKALRDLSGIRFNTHKARLHTSFVFVQVHMPRSASLRNHSYANMPLFPFCQ